MDIKTKLVELLDTNCGYVEEVEAKVFADYLLAHDVTIMRHGRWLYDGGRGKYFCSACNEYALSFKKDTLCGDDLYDECLTDYCPSCGARMDGKA